MSQHTQDPRGSGGWTPERVARLEQLWRQGVSASQTAARLGVTRNAVIGKVHRLGLSQDGLHARAAGAQAPARPAPSLSRASAPRRPMNAKPLPEGPAIPKRRAVGGPLPDAELERPLAADLASLTGHQCRWPIGDPKAADFGFCGRGRAGGPYCAGHAARAFRGRPRASPAGRPAGAGA